MAGLISCTALDVVNAQTSSQIPAQIPAQQTPPQQSKPTPEREGEAEALVKDCVGKLQGAIQLQGEFQDYFTQGVGKADYESGKITPRMSRYYQRYCPRLRNIAPFQEFLCLATFSIVKVPIEESYLKGLAAFTNDIVGLCDRQFKPDTMGAGEYQRLFDREVRKNRYPETVSAVCENGEPRFSGVFEPYPKKDFGFYSHHGASDEAFRIQDSNYTVALSFKRIWHNRIECGGRAYNQSVWIPK
ncbi:MAG: hypothetical protein ACRCWO_05215 [Bosea sp. (in: a-proteobacteria)]